MRIHLTMRTRFVVSYSNWSEIMQSHDGSTVDHTPDSCSTETNSLQAGSWWQPSCCWCFHLALHVSTAYYLQQPFTGIRVANDQLQIGWPWVTTARQDCHVYPTHQYKNSTAPVRPRRTSLGITGPAQASTGTASEQGLACRSIQNRHLARRPFFVLHHLAYNCSFQSPVSCSRTPWTDAGLVPRW